jgi:hypothetical protein
VSQLAVEYDDDEDVVASRYLPEEILQLIMTELSVSPPIAGRAFGLGVSSSYRAVRSGAIPSYRIGAKFAVPTMWLRKKLGLVEPASQPALPQPAQSTHSPKAKRRRRY